MWQASTGPRHPTAGLPQAVARVPRIEQRAIPEPPLLSESLHNKALKPIEGCRAHVFR
jgi:hypothetical protein